jgi:hypothetical protein
MAIAELSKALDEFLEAAADVERTRALAPIERRLEAQMQRAFRVQQRELLARLRRKPAAAVAVKEALAIGDFDRVWSSVAKATAKVFLGPIVTAWKAAFGAGAKSLFTAVGVPKGKLANGPSAEILRQRGADRVSGINDETRDQIRRILVEGAEKGWPPNQVAKAISERYTEFRVGVPQEHIRSRAHLVAVTEAGDAYMEANLLAAQQLHDGGTELEKSWSTVGDDRVSEGCQENEAAGWIPLGDAFPSGHQRPLRFPGCRCVLMTQRKET